MRSTDTIPVMPARPLILVTFILLLMLSFGAASGASANPQSAAASVPSAAAIDAYLAGKGSPMAGQGAAFIVSGGRWQVDPRLVVAIAGAESNFGGITCAPFNAWGWGCPNGPYSFSTWAEGIEAVTKGLRNGYLSEGRISVAQINMKYAPIGAANDPTGLNNHWSINVSRFLTELGGDPNNVDLNGVAGTLNLGVELGDSSDSYGFNEVAAKSKDEAKPLTLAPNIREPLTIQVENTGLVNWNARDIRLMRVDLDSRIAGAPFGYLANGTTVKPGEKARFSIVLTANGIHTAKIKTRWRLEGPSGYFGAEIERDITVKPSSFSVTDPQISVRESTGDGVYPVLVRVRNTGLVTWQNSGDNAVQLLHTPEPLAPEAQAKAPSVNTVGDGVAANMLEREAAPGENATFAFSVQGAGKLYFLVKMGDQLAVDTPILVDVQ